MSQQSNAPAIDPARLLKMAAILTPEAVPRSSSRVVRPVIERYDPTAYDPPPLSADMLTALSHLWDDARPMVHCPECGEMVTVEGLAMISA